MASRPSPANSSTLAMAALVGAGFIYGYNWVVTEPGPTWSGPYAAALLHKVILACAVALLLWFYTLRHLPAGTPGLGRLVPVVGVIASWIQLGERPDRSELIGVGLIIVGLASLALWQILADRRTRRTEETSAALAD
jgi:drug/metabolite transporter (DMT)-like permease